MKSAELRRLDTKSLMLEIRIKQDRKETMLKQLLVLARLRELEMKTVRVCKKYNL